MKTQRLTTTLRLLLTAALFLPCLAQAQQRSSSGPAPIKPRTTTVPDVALPEVDPLFSANQAVPPGKQVVPPAKATIMVNFQDASLNDVLNYLSEAAGFVVVQEVKVEGKINVVSRQPITADDAVDLLNTVLLEKGYVAIRNGRILKVVNRKNAERRDLPVRTGSDPELIPRKDEMVTQILPLRFGEAAKLVENLRPLLAENATINANEGSNSILLTDTQTNIRRIAEIIRAIDTSVASISTLHVYQLKYANAKELATVITQLFAPATTGAAGQGGNQGGGRRGYGGGGYGGPGGQQQTPQSEARQANSRVIAVADDQSNSLIVSAPEDVIPSISEVVNKIDTNISDVTDTRIFHLVHADAMETADIINTLYGDAASLPKQARSGSNQRGTQSRQTQPQQPATNANQSERALQQSRVVAVGDGRTNSLIVSAAQDTMVQIAETVSRLDATDAKKQHVYVHSLQHADADSVADVLRGMLGQQTNSANSKAGSGRLNQRSATGATIDTSDASSNLTGSGGGRAR